MSDDHQFASMNYRGDQVPADGGKPLTERDLTYVRTVRELGAGNDPLFSFFHSKYRVQM